ncbi:MAG: agmatinase [Caldilineaceae bacterium]
MSDDSTPDNFLGLPDELADPVMARVVVLPIPFEATVSYGGGTAAGPAAIITASQQVELYDREFDAEPVLGWGVHTLPALVLPDDPEAAVNTIADAVALAASGGRLFVGLGGEHTISSGVGRGLLRALGGPLTVVQIDAHSDLRDSYEETLWSHACVARRLLDLPEIEQIIQLGIRSVCREEVEVARSEPARVRVWYAEAVHTGAWRRELADRLRGRRVFLTIDVDGLDPAIVPATGTPEPDGLTWNETLDLVRTVSECAEIVGLDCVELAPHPGQHAADFAVAKLLYKVITFAMRSRRSEP